MRMLAYGIVTNCVDEYLKIVASTALECLKNFSVGVVQTFRQDYLRKATQVDIHHLLAIIETRDFPRMLGSIDCMYWEWKNCPSGWKGERRVRKRKLQSSYFDSWSCCFLWLMDLACLLRMPRKHKLFECAWSFTGFSRVIWKLVSKLWICGQRSQVQHRLLPIWWYLSKMGDLRQNYSSSSRAKGEIILLNVKNRFERT